MTFLNTYKRVIVAFLGLIFYTTSADAYYLPPSENLRSSLKSEMVGMTGLHGKTLVAMRPQSTGHHPKIIKHYLLPELKTALFSQYNLPRQTGCLAVAIYYEARGESFNGQVAVSQVILNRVTSRKYPGNICDVVYQNAYKKNRCQFSFACDGKVENPRNRQAWKKSMFLAKVLTGDSGIALYMKNFLLDTVLNQKFSRSTHYHADYARPIWRKKLQRSGQIGQHIFYVSNRVWL